MQNSEQEKEVRYILSKMEKDRCRVSASEEEKNSG
jgi:hypothetical protein